MAVKYDAIIIGTGQAGPTLASRLAGAGHRTAIIERARFGGTCVNTGCTPTKALVASARAAHVARRADDYGVVIDGPVTVDMKRVKARKDGIVRRSREGQERWLKGLDNVAVYEGHARFVGPHSVQVGETVLEAERVYINVGGRALVPDLAGLEGVPYWTNSSIMDVDFVPEHLVIVGGSYVGLEFGQMYRRFGSRVTIVEKGPRLIAREDEDVSQAVQEILEGEGVEVRLGAECISMRRDGDGVRIGVECDPSDEREVAGSHVLLAVGRRPNTDDLGLDAAGIEVDGRGYIQVDEALETSTAGVWALGDVNGRGAFTHTSFNDHEIVADNLLKGDERRVSDRITAYALYVDPPLGRAGMTEAEVRSSGRPALIARRPMSRVSRAVEKGETQGFMKVLVDAETRQILGAAALGVGGDEVIHLVLDVMYAKAPVSVLERAVHIHPTVAELIPTMLGALEPLS